MKIAVVGANGFIGRHLVNALEFNEYPVRKIYHGDFFDFSDIELVYNVAGVTGGGALLRDKPLAMVGPNLRIALDVFDAAKHFGVKHVVAMSSTTGYPDAAHPITEDEYFDGKVYPAYKNPGETRRFIEKLGRMYPFDLTFLRCAGAYGPGDDYDPKTSHVIGATIRKVAHRQNPLVIWGDGEDARDGTYIDDLIQALLLASKCEGKESINIGTGELMTVNEMVSVLCDYINFHPVITHDTTKPVMVRKRVLDCSKAKAMLGWGPKVSMRDGLCQTLIWKMKQDILSGEA